MPFIASMQKFAAASEISVTIFSTRGPRKACFQFGAETFVSDSLAHNAHSFNAMHAMNDSA